MKIHILLADDHTILRAGLKMMLNAQPDMEVIGEAQDGRQAISEGIRLQPDIILMDITMPDMNGIEATRQVKKMLPEVKVLVLTMHENDEYVFQALRAGASGYMLKEAADTELITALHVIQSGKFYLSPSAQSVMVGDYLQRVRTGEEKDTYSSLTEREREILKLRRQAEAVKQSEDQYRDACVRLNAEELLKAVHVVERLVDDGEPDDGVDNVRIRLDPSEDADQERDAVADRKKAHVLNDVLHAIQEEDHTDQKRQMVVSGDHVLGTQVHEGTDGTAVNRQQE